MCHRASSCVSASLRLFGFRPLSFQQVVGQSGHRAGLCPGPGQRRAVHPLATAYRMLTVPSVSETVPPMRSMSGRRQHPGLQPDSRRSVASKFTICPKYNMQGFWNFGHAMPRGELNSKTELLAEPREQVIMRIRFCYVTQFLGQCSWANAGNFERRGLQVE